MGSFFVGAEQRIDIGEFALEGLTRGHRPIEDDVFGPLEGHCRW